jgi:hypothetical protein
VHGGAVCTPAVPLKLSGATASGRGGQAVHDHDLERGEPVPPEAAQKDEYDAKLDALAEVIIDAGPVLLALQEVGDEASFEDLLARLRAGSNGALSTHFEPAHPIRVGWLSPGELIDVARASARDAGSRAGGVAGVIGR